MGCHEFCPCYQSCELILFASLRQMGCAATCTATDIQPTFDTFQSCVLRLELRSMSTTRSRCSRRRSERNALEPILRLILPEWKGEQNPPRSRRDAAGVFDRKPRWLPRAHSPVRLQAASDFRRRLPPAQPQCSSTLTVGYQLAPSPESDWDLRVGRKVA